MRSLEDRGFGLMGERGGRRPQATRLNLRPKTVAGVARNNTNKPNQPRKPIKNQKLLVGAGSAFKEIKRDRFLRFKGLNRS